jgi:hypothetical protein
MPARSTPFQNLVAHIQTRLSAGASVEESALLRHRMTGEAREVDVVIRSSIGEHPVVVSVECIDQSRQADTTWIEQMKTKHDHLETDRLVLVSRSGFYEPALRLAASLGISTYTPEEAVRQDWMRLVGESEMFLARFDYTPVMTWIQIQKVEGPTFVEAGDATEIRRPDIGARGKLRDLTMHCLNSRAFSLPAMDGHVRDDEASIQVDFNLGVPILAVDLSGREHAVLQLRAKVKAVRRTSLIPIQSMSWKGTPAAFGHAETALGKTVITVVEEKLGKMAARVIADGRELEVHSRDDLGGNGGPSEQ